MAKADKTNDSQLDELEKQVAAAEADMAARFPSLAAAIAAAKASGDKTPIALRTRAMTEGYRRGGLRHSVEPKDWPLPGPSTEELDAIFADKQIAAEFVFAD